jgi:hypothetical protein
MRDERRGVLLVNLHKTRPRRTTSGVVSSSMIPFNPEQLTLLLIAPSFEGAWDPAVCIQNICLVTVRAICLADSSLV